VEVFIGGWSKEEEIKLSVVSGFSAKTLDWRGDGKAFMVNQVKHRIKARSTLYAFLFI
jgi:hypothetical protein